MNVRALGPLKPDHHVRGWLVSEPKEIPFFDGLKLPFFLDSLEDADEQEVEGALGSFFKLGPVDREAVSPYVFANYRRMAEMVDEEDLDCRIESEDDVWQHVHPSEIHISKRHRRDPLDLHFGCRRMSLGARAWERISTTASKGTGAIPVAPPE